MNIPVVFEDDWFMVLDKPAGLLVIPTPKNESRTLTSILNEDLKARNVSYRLHPCHRLDRDTSGLIMYAKGKSLQKKIMVLLRQKKIKKTYLAFVQGVVTKSEGIIREPIENREAVTQYRVLERKKDYSVVEVKPLTGRTNQIRIHFKHIGHPIVGETRFSFRRDFRLKARRLCLHAQALELVHPVTGKNIRVAIDMPRDMQEFLHKHAS